CRLLIAGALGQLRVSRPSNVGRNRGSVRRATGVALALRANRETVLLSQRNISKSSKKGSESKDVNLPCGWDSSFGQSVQGAPTSRRATRPFAWRTLRRLLSRKRPR